MSSQMLFLHPRFQEYYNSRSKSQIQYIFVITGILMVIASGLSGMLVEALLRVRSSDFSTTSEASVISIHYVDVFPSIILQLLFFGLLLAFYRLFFTNKSVKTSLNEIDIIILMQLAIAKDLLYLVYIYLNMNFQTGFTSSMYYISDGSTMYYYLYVIFVIFVILFLIPKIAPIFSISTENYNRGLLYSFLLSLAFLILVTIIILAIRPFLFILFSS